VLGVTLVLGAALLAMRATLPAAEAVLEPIQIIGDVPDPGWYLLDHATLHHALAAAGADPAPWPDLPLVTGWRVVVQDGDVHLEPSGEELVFGLPLDLNRADQASLEALPGVGPALAGAILAHQRDHGPFHDLDGLLQVPGVGPARLEALRPFVTVAP